MQFKSLLGRKREVLAKMGQLSESSRPHSPDLMGLSFSQRSQGDLMCTHGTVNWGNLFQIQEKAICLALTVCGKQHHSTQKARIYMSACQPCTYLLVCQSANSSCGCLVCGHGLKRVTASSHLNKSLVHCCGHLLINSCQSFPT